MAQLTTPILRGSRQEHRDDHTELHRLHNILDLIDFDALADDTELTTLSDLVTAIDGRLELIEAIGSLATDAELVALTAAILGDADEDADTLGELRALLNVRLAAAANLSDLTSLGDARTNLDVYSKSEIDTSLQGIYDYEDSLVGLHNTQQAEMVANFAGAAGVVMHGDSLEAGRPTQYGMVIWVGSVEPPGMIEGDLWLNTEVI